MDLLKKLLLGYCSLFALFLFLSGIVSSKTPQGLIPQLVFLPVVGFFIYTLITSILQRNRAKQSIEHTQDEPKSPFKRSSLILILAVLLMLLSVSIINIIKKPSMPDLDNRSLSKQINNEKIKDGILLPSSKEKTSIRIIGDDDTTTINIREAATISATIISKTHRDQLFSVITKSGDWYKVLLEDGRNGFINSKFASEVKKESLTK
jgi:uncharacterized protein YgiM (DUF1202 family)